MEVARRAAEAASEKQAVDIVLLDARVACSFADYFVMCTGDSNRQIQAIYDEIAHTMKKAGVTPLHYEGTVDSGWLLLDYGDVIVHIFAPFERDYYMLDKLWSDVTVVLSMQ